MDRCTVCNGRTMNSELGPKCMNASCRGSELEAPDESKMICRCGEVMSYQGEDSWGQPNFVCIYCGATKRIEK